MVRLSKRELERKVQTIEDDSSGEEIAVFLTAVTDDALRTVLLVEHHAREGESQTPVITTGPDSLKSRLRSALSDLRADDGVEVGVETYIEYIAGRYEGEIRPGEDGITSHFDGSMGPGQVDRVWRSTVEAAR